MDIQKISACSRQSLFPPGRVDGPAREVAYSLLAVAVMRVSCILFGHEMHPDRRSCRCGKPMGKKGLTRVRHVVSCFLGGHHYIHVGARQRHEEYRCTRCGHPLLFQTGIFPSDPKIRFKKKVRYQCNLFGHTVHSVTGRDSFHEYACFCGHTFLKKQRRAQRIQHPLICLFAGHFVTHLSVRAGLSEFLCKHCGHTFLVESVMSNKH